MKTVVRSIFVTNALMSGKFLSYGRDTLHYIFSLKHRGQERKVREPLEVIQDATMLKGVMLDRDGTHSEKKAIGQTAAKRRATSGRSSSRRRHTSRRTTTRHRASTVTC